MQSPGSLHLQWHADALWMALNPLLPDISVEVLARTDSTNTQLVERARRHSGLRSGPVSQPGELDSVPGALSTERTPHGRRNDDTRPVLLVAEHQTGGRGRQGRTWLGGAGASLTFSLSLPYAPQQWSGLSLALGLAIADALDPPGAHAPRIGLKWPNDLWLWEGPGQGRKLGGILIETVAVGQRRMCIVGVGLNILPQALPDLAQGYACLQELDANTSAPQALAQLAVPLARALRDFEQAGLGPKLPAYARRDVLAGQALRGSDGLQGLGLGIAEDGALRLRDAQAQEQLLRSAEVSVRPVAAAPGASGSPA